MTALAFDGASIVRESLGLGAEGSVWQRWEQGPLAARCLLARDGSFDPDAEAVVCIGAFDGFHVGHRALMAAAQADARLRGLPCLALTFEPDPAELFLGDRAPSRLLSCEDRAQMIVSTGVDAVVMLAFDEHLASLSPQDFVDQVLCGLVRPASLHVGSNFHFGRAGSGDEATLCELGRQRGFGVTVHPLVEHHGAPVSSTRVRTLLGQPAGLEEANGLLGRCHFLRGLVAHGRGEGTSFGFPTANVHFSTRFCLPAEGVYAGYVSMDGAAWPAAINVGAPPSFSVANTHFCEANLLGFSGDLYGSEVAVSFVSWLRASRSFDSLDELERVVMGNIDWVRTHLGTTRVEVEHDH